MKSHGTILFSSTQVDEFRRERIAEASNHVDDIPVAEFCASSDEQIVEHLMSLHEVQMVELCLDKMALSSSESSISAYGIMGCDPRLLQQDVRLPSNRFEVMVPFTGDARLWWVSPSQGVTRRPFGKIITRPSGVGTLVIELEDHSEAPAERYKNKLDDEVRLINDFLKALSIDIEQINTAMRGRVKSVMEARRKRLANQVSVREALNIPLVKKPGEPDFSTLAIQRRRVRPLVASQGHSVDPSISDGGYEDILGLLRHTGRTFERLPKTFARHDEMGLRDILLANLNCHFLGSATGETFRGLGKTDICIEADNRAAFVAECKIWRHKTDAEDAINQLLDYATLRDSKNALIFFNKSVREFSKVQTNLQNVLRAHPHFAGSDTSNEAGEWRFRFHSANDPANIMLVHIFFFNIYVRRARPVNRVTAA